MKIRDFSYCCRKPMIYRLGVRCGHCFEKTSWIEITDDMMKYSKQTLEGLK